MLAPSSMWSPLVCWCLPSSFSLMNATITASSWTSACGRVQHCVWSRIPVSVRDRGCLMMINIWCNDLDFQKELRFGSHVVTLCVCVCVFILCCRTRARRRRTPCVTSASASSAWTSVWARAETGWPERPRCWSSSPARPPSSPRVRNSSVCLWNLYCSMSAQFVSLKKVSK